MAESGTENLVVDPCEYVKQELPVCCKDMAIELRKDGQEQTVWLLGSRAGRSHASLEPANALSARDRIRSGRRSNDFCITKVVTKASSASETPQPPQRLWTPKSLWNRFLSAVLQSCS